MKMVYLTVVVVLLVLLSGCGHPTEEGLLFKTADPKLSIGFRWASPSPGEIAPDVIPGEEVGEVVPEPAIPPPCAEIKGNISRDGRKLYHDKDSPNYTQVKIDEGGGERWFCSVEEAEAAGWTKAGG